MNWSLVGYTPGHFEDYCITGFMKQIQCNATPTTPKKVLLYLILRTTRPVYAGTTTIALNTPQNPYLNQATQKNTCPILLPKNPSIENLKPKKIRRSSRTLEIRSTPTGVRFVTRFAQCVSFVFWFKVITQACYCWRFSLQKLSSFR